MLHQDIIDEFFIWRLVTEKVVSYESLEFLNFIDALKLNAILDYRDHIKEEQRLEMEAQTRSENGTKS